MTKKGTFRMSAKERNRLVVMERVKAGELSVREASERMGVTHRQGKRIWARFRQAGAGGLAHRGRDRLSNRRLDDDLRHKVLELYDKHYKGFGPTLLWEYLSERHGIEVSRETLRQWLTAHGDWQPGKRRCRKARARRERFGELVQMDGSIHRWLGEEGEMLCLMVMIDDATGDTEALLARGETLEAALTILGRWIAHHGVPEALYVDGRSTYVGNDGEGDTDFARACQELGIRIIRAHSPQAKGRVERMNGTLQDRLVKYLRVEGAKTLEEANVVLPAFLEGLNARFRREAASPVDAHRKAPAPEVLAEILAPEETRSVDRDGTISIGKCRYSLNDAPRARTRVRVRRCLDGTFIVRHGTKRLSWQEAPR